MSDQTLARQVDDPSAEALAATPEPAAKRPSRRAALLRARAAASSVCVLTGPAGAGKSMLLDSLDQPRELACSTPGWRVVRAAEPARGLGGAALSLEREGRTRGRRLAVTVQELPLDLAREAEPTSMLLCLPLRGVHQGGEGERHDQETREALLDLLGVLSNRQKRPRRLVLCFTKYERLFQRAGRDALWHAAFRDTARDVLIWALEDEGPYGFLRPALASVAAQRRVWLQPVSSFGFVAGNGGANAAPDGQSRRTRWLHQLRGSDSAGESDWRPFLTQDALLLAGAGRAGRLSFSWRSLAG